MGYDQPSEQAMKKLYSFVSRVLPKYINKLNQIEHSLDNNKRKNTDEVLQILSLKQAAEHLGLSEITLKRRIYAKQIKAYKDGGYWKIKREWILEYQNKLIEESVT